MVLINASKSICIILKCEFFIPQHRRKHDKSNYQSNWLTIDINVHQKSSSTLSKPFKYNFEVKKLKTKLIILKIKKWEQKMINKNVNLMNKKYAHCNCDYVTVSLSIFWRINLCLCFVMSSLWTCFKLIKYTPTQIKLLLKSNYYSIQIILKILIWLKS